MFSSFSAYLFGSSGSNSSNVEEDCEKENEFTTVETDGDWLIVESCKHETDLKPEENESHDDPLQGSESKRRVDAIVACWINTLRQPRDKTVPRVSMAVETKPWMLDSWYITPPSCFTSGPHCLVETSPLENLLIEHPSMSVYARVNGVNASCDTANKPGIEADLGPCFMNMMTRDIPVTRSYKIEDLFQIDRVRRGPQHPCGIAALHEHVQNQAPVQKAKVLQETKFMHGKQLERHNKTQEFQSIGKRHRRKGFMKCPSGKSNNRKY